MSVLRCALLLLVGLVGALQPAIATAQRARLDVDVFARIPSPPGLPEGIATGPDGTVYVGTNPGGNAPGPQNGAKSKIFAFRPDGTPVRDYTIEGQTLTQATLPAYGLQQLAFDGAGLLYALDKAPARVLRIDPSTGTQTTYATFEDVKPCSATGGRQPCSATVEDAPAFPNYPAFARDGSMIVSDFQQALLWRVPPGGGRAQVLLTDPRLENPIGGPNGLQFRADGKTLVVAQSIALPQNTTRLFETTVDRGAASPLEQFYESPTGDGGDGLAIGRSGDVYLNSFTTNQVIRVAPDGREVERIGSAPGDEVPFDAPASSVFVDDRLLITNQSVTVRNPASFAVLDVFVGEPGLPLLRPTPGGAGGTGPGQSPSARKRPAIALARVRVRPASRRRHTSLVVRGTLRRPPGVSRAAGCRGRVRVSATGRSGVGGKSSRLARVSSRCTFSATLRARGRGRNRIRARFVGNRALRPVLATAVARV